jgi:hypothetical protein
VTSSRRYGCGDVGPPSSPADPAGTGNRRWGPVPGLSAPNPRAARSDQAPRVDDSIPASFFRWAKLHALFVCAVAKPGPDRWLMARDARRFELGPL